MTTTQMILVALGLTGLAMLFPRARGILFAIAATAAAMIGWTALQRGRASKRAKEDTDYVNQANDDAVIDILSGRVRRDD